MGNIVFLGIKMGDIEGFQWHGHIGITYQGHNGDGHVFMLF